jgi:hypothetical protein
VLDVILAVESGDVGPSQSASAGVAQEVESSKIVSLTQRILARTLIRNGEEFRGDDFAAVLDIPISMNPSRTVGVSAWNLHDK